MEKETKYHRRRSIIREFCLNTSTHALPGIARSENMCNRLFWSFSFTSFTAIMVYFVVKAIMAYFEYPTQMDIEYVSERPQSFPAFSLCNASPLRFDKFRDPFLNFTRIMNIPDANYTFEVTSLHANYIGGFITTKINNNESISFMFYSLSSMLQMCEYNSVPCNETDFIPFVSSTYGLCYTFNAQLKNVKSGGVHDSNENGGTGVLKLGLYVHSHQYVPYVSDGEFLIKPIEIDIDFHYCKGIGIVGLVHDNTELPLIESAGIELAPGLKHKLGYRKTTAYFAPAPFTTCTDKVPILMEAMFSNYEGADYGYSETLCYQICGQVYA